jgi:hypothetical protein
LVGRKKQTVLLHLYSEVGQEHSQKQKGPLHLEETLSKRQNRLDVNSEEPVCLFLFLVTFGASHGASRFVFILEFFVTGLALAMISLFEFYDLSVGFQFMASCAFLYFLAFLPYVLSIFVLMVTVCTFQGFVFGMWEKNRTLLEILENVPGMNADVPFGGLVGGKSKPNHQCS